MREREKDMAFGAMSLPLIVLIYIYLICQALILVRVVCNYEECKNIFSSLLHLQDENQGKVETNPSNCNYVQLIVFPIKDTHTKTQMWFSLHTNIHAHFAFSLL